MHCPCKIIITHSWAFQVVDKHLLSTQADAYRLGLASGGWRLDGMDEDLLRHTKDMKQVCAC